MFEYTTTTTQQREAFRRLVSQTDAPKTYEIPPYAAPFAKLNTWASRMEPTFIDPVRDVPRVHNAAGLPLWAVLPPPFVQPISEASKPKFVSRFFADFAQIGVDVTVGACALGAALCLYLTLRPAQAKEVLRDHMLHVMDFFLLGAILTGAWQLQVFFRPSQVPYV